MSLAGRQSFSSNARVVGFDFDGGGERWDNADTRRQPNNDADVKPNDNVKPNGDTNPDDDAN